MSLETCISEIFSSLQGEGIYAGEKMTFVRFTDCSLGCKWCDTKKVNNEQCNIYYNDSKAPDFSFRNPITVAKLSSILDEFSNEFVSITGGEPLEHVEFLAHFLPNLKHKRKILLETNGVKYEELKLLRNNIDIISMDIKLPSSAGLKPLWKEHALFLRTALEICGDLYVKLVVTGSTTDIDLNNAIKLISSTNRYIPVVIQPVSPTESFSDNVTEDQLLSFKRLFTAWLPNVTVKKQMHKIWDIK